MSKNLLKYITIWIKSNWNINAQMLAKKQLKTVVFSCFANRNLYNIIVNNIYQKALDSTWTIYLLINLILFSCKNFANIWESKLSINRNISSRYVGNNEYNWTFVICRFFRFCKQIANETPKYWRISGVIRSENLTLPTQEKWR